MLDACDRLVTSCKAALSSAHTAAESEVDALARDLKLQHSLVDRLTDATDSLLGAEESAHAAAISTMPAVADAIEASRAACTAARKRMAVTMRKELPDLERAVVEAEAATSHAAKEVGDARADMDAAETERSSLRAALHPILSRVAALTAAVEVGLPAIRSSQKVVD